MYIINEDIFGDRDQLKFRNIVQTQTVDIILCGKSATSSRMRMSNSPNTVGSLEKGTCQLEVPFTCADMILLDSWKKSVMRLALVDCAQLEAPGMSVFTLW